MVPTRLLSTAAGLACGALLIVHGPEIGGTGGVAVADESVGIESPAGDAVVSGPIEIRGTATSADPSQFDFYRVYVGNGRTPAAMRPLGPPRDAPVVSGVLASLDTRLLAPGEALIQLSVYEKGGRQSDVSVVFVVQPGPAPTRTFNAPEVVVPPVTALAPQPEPSAPSGTVEYPVAAMPDVAIPQFDPVAPSVAPIPRLTAENIYDTLPGDPVQTDPIYNDIPDLSR